MKRTIPLLITATSGIVLVLAFFIPFAQAWGEAAAIWFDILASIAFLLGGGNLLAQHLRKISDQRKGWGFSAVIVVSFLLTMFFGLSKWGSRPLGKTEFLGESFAAFPITALPEYILPGTLPQRADGTGLPVSLRRQLREEQGNIVFQGWMTPSQMEDLLKYQDDLRWRAVVEELFELAQPPAALRSKLKYHADQGVLAFAGVMSSEEQIELNSLLADRPGAAAAISTLAEQSRAETRIRLPALPAGLEIPNSAADRVRLNGDELTVIGPISPGFRAQLAGTWPNFPRFRGLDTEGLAALQSRIETAGAPLTPAQIEVFEQYFAPLNTSSAVLALSLNSAGVTPPRTRTYRELWAAYEAGDRFLERTVPTTEPAVELNAAQLAVLDTFSQETSQTAAELQAALAAAGPFPPAMARKLEDYFSALPTEAVVLRDLCQALLRSGDLTAGQRSLLLEPYREQFLWQQAIGELTIAAHRTKFPWSGDYSESGTPFWWLYQYVFQPLLTTTFAVLAFYVASAAFRAFRAKNLEASLLLGTAFIILLRPTFIGGLYSAMMPDWLGMDALTSFFMGTMTTAGNRAIMIGIALGIASTSLKVLLGIDRSYLGSGD